MLSTKNALPILTKSIIFAMAATVSMNASAGDTTIDEAAVLNGESTELVVTESEAVEMTEEELAEKEVLENQAEGLVPAE